MQLHRHRGCLFAMGAGPSRRRIGVHHRPLVEEERQRDQVIIATKVGMEMGPDKKGLSRPTFSARSRIPCAGLQIDCIDLYQARIGRSGDAAGGNARRLRRPDQAGEGPGDRRLQLHRRAAGAGAGDQPRTGLPRYECLQPHYNLCERADYETKLEPVCLANGSASSPISRWPRAS